MTGTETCFQKGESTVAYKELPELKENGNTVVTELDNGNILLVNGSMKGKWRWAEIQSEQKDWRFLKFVPHSVWELQDCCF